MASFLSFLFYVLVLLIPTTCRAHLRRPEKLVAFFIFGDSLLDPGNNNYINTTTDLQANFPPYGENFFKLHPTGRFCDGRLISDFIAEYAKLPLIPPFLQPGAQFTHGANFASAGAGVLVETYQGKVIDLNMQLRNFKKVKTWLRNKMGDAKAKKTISSAVYFISIGTNDYLSPFVTGINLEDSFSQKQEVGKVIGNLTIVIKDIYMSGGRKFGFLSLGPIGCGPGVRVLKPENKGGGCLEEASQLARLHNTALSKLLKELEKQLSGFKYSDFEFYTFLSQRMNHPLKFGFKEGKSACCGTGPFKGVNSCGGRRAVKEYQLCEDPREYVFWDFGHPSERTYGQLAKQMWGGTRNVVRPYNLKDLFESVEI